MGSPDCRQDQPHTTIQLHLLGGVGRGMEPPSFLAQVSSACPTLCPQIQDSEHIKVENSEQGSKLTIRAARQEHCGCYTLLVENKLGSRQAQVNLTVVGESGEGRAEARMAGFQAFPLGYSPSTCGPSAHGLSFSPCSYTVAALLLVENQILHIQCFPFSVTLLRLPSLALGDPEFHHHSSP